MPYLYGATNMIKEGTELSISSSLAESIYELAIGL